MHEGARWGSGRRRQEVRGLQSEAAKIRVGGGGEEAVVLWMREGARWGSGRRHQEVRGLQAEAAKLRVGGGGEEVVVLWMREGARWGSGRRHQEITCNNYNTKKKIYSIPYIRMSTCRPPTREETGFPWMSPLCWFSYLFFYFKFSVGISILNIFRGMRAAAGERAS
jgi:hypothetical protein